MRGATHPTRAAGRIPYRPGQLEIFPPRNGPRLTSTVRAEGGGRGVFNGGVAFPFAEGVLHSILSEWGRGKGNVDW